MSRPTNRIVAVVIPTLNEAERIGALLAQLTRLPGDLVTDILVADGRSADATRAIVADAAIGDVRIRLVDNPDRIQSAGINRAVALADARADTIVRIDAHAHYPDDYVPRIVEAFAATGAEMVAVRLATRGTTCTQHGIAAASNSRVGTGGSAHRVGGKAGFVDHGHHAGMDRAMFDRVGGYDPAFVANEDAELDLRVRRAGGRIWLATGIEVDYAPRKSLAALARQYWRYGQGRAGTIRKHRERPRLRQMLPPIVVIALAAALLGALVEPLLLAVPALYLAAIAVATAALFAESPRPCTLIAAPALVVVHLAWGTGFLVAMAGAGGRTVRDRNRFARVQLSDYEQAEVNKT